MASDTGTRDGEARMSRADLAKALALTIAA